MKKILLVVSLAAVSLMLWPNIMNLISPNMYVFPEGVVWTELVHGTNKDGKSYSFHQIAISIGGQWRCEIKKNGKLFVAVYDGNKLRTNSQSAVDAVTLNPRTSIEDLLKKINESHPDETATDGGILCSIYRTTLPANGGACLLMDQTARFPRRLNSTINGESIEHNYAIVATKCAVPNIFNASEVNAKLFEAYKISP